MEPRELVEELAKALVERPEEVAVSELKGEQVTVIELKVAKEDIGKVIGRGIFRIAGQQHPASRSRPSGLAENVIYLAIRQMVNLGLHLHAHLNISFGDIAGKAAEYLVRPVIQNRDRIGQIAFESHRGILKFAVGKKFACSGNRKPLHITGNAVVTIRTRRKELPAACPAAGAHNLALFEVS